jgi:hypothetical protein
MEDVMPIRIGPFEDMSDEELEQLRRHKHHRGDPALHELLSRVEAGIAQKVPIQDGQSGKGLRVAIARAAKQRGMWVETAEGDGFVGVWQVPEPQERKPKQPSGDGRRGRPRKPQDAVEITLQQDLASQEA